MARKSASYGLGTARVQLETAALLSTNVWRNVTYGLRLRGERDGKADMQAVFESPRDPRTAAFVNGEMVY